MGLLQFSGKKCSREKKGFCHESNIGWTVGTKEERTHGWADQKELGQQR